MFKTILIVLCLGLTAACATAPSNEMASAQSEASVEAATPAENQEGVAQETAVASSEVDDDRIICKRTIVTGSRFAKKVCKTWGEWKALEQDSQDGLNRTQRMGTYGTPDALGQ